MKTKFSLIILLSLIIFPLKPNNSHKSFLKTKKKPWNFMVYITSNNDLYPFSEQNIRQMMEIGSNENVNIIIQQDTYGKDECKRIYIEKGNQKIIQKIKTQPQNTTGTPENLYNFIEWGTKNFPAEKLAIILWDHGSGIIDPNIWKSFFKFNPLILYKINLETGMFELNRELINKRGICFNEVFQVYLNNQDLRGVLSKVSKNLLNNKKIDIIGLDACNMAMLEIASQIKDFAQYMVASEEYEPGTGWNYMPVLKPFESKNPTPYELSKNIVDAYQKNYEYNYYDFTQSAINLNLIDSLEANIDTLSKELIKLLQGKYKNKIKKHIREIRHSRMKTTKFANPNYIDLHHFYKSISSLTKKLSNKYKDIRQNLRTISEIATIGHKIIDEIIISKTFCPSLPFIGGISFYFPTKSIHNTYSYTNFAKNNNWYSFLKYYLK